MTPEQLKRPAILAHHCYGSFDLTANWIHRLTEPTVFQLMLCSNP